MRSWAGWNRLVEEEGQLRDALLRGRKGHGDMDCEGSATEPDLSLIRSS